MSAGLAEEPGALRIEAQGEPGRRSLQGMPAHSGAVVLRGHRVVVRDEIVRLVGLLQLQRGPDHPEVVAHMDVASGLDTGQCALHHSLQLKRTWT